MAVTTLAQYYTGQGKALPSLQARGQLYQQYGLGTGYAGTAQQNTSLLQKLLAGQPQTSQSINTAPNGQPLLGPVAPSQSSPTSGAVNIVNGQAVPVGGSPTIGNTGIPQFIQGQMPTNATGTLGPNQIYSTASPQGQLLTQGLNSQQTATIPSSSSPSTTNTTTANMNMTPTGDQNKTALASMMAQTGSQTGTDTFGLDTKSTDELQQIMQAIQSMNTQNTPNYTDILNQARTAQNIPGLQQNILDLQQQAQAVNAQQRQMYYQPQINGMTGGVMQSGVNAAQQAVSQGQTPQSLGNILNALSLAEQGNLAQNQLNYAQGNVAQSLGAAEAQGSLGIQQGQLSLQQQSQEAMLPYQQALTAAQAQQAQAQAGFYQSIYGGLTSNPSNAVGGGTATQLPSYVQGAMSTDINGQGYIVESRIPSLGGMGLDAAKVYAGQAGVPILNDSQAASIAGLDVTQNNLKDLQSKIGDLLGSGLGGTIQGHTLNEIEKMLGIGNGPALQQIDSFREAAIKQIQGLASGGSGLRINQAEIDSAIKNLPTTSDNIETAKAKLNQVAIFFANQRAAMYALGGLRAASAPVNDSVGWGF